MLGLFDTGAGADSDGKMTLGAEAEMFVLVEANTTAATANIWLVDLDTAGAIDATKDSVQLIGTLDTTGTLTATNFVGTPAA